MCVPMCPRIVAIVAVLLAPAFGAPAELSGLAFLSRSDDYQVWVNDREQFVYKSTKNGTHGTHEITTMSFVGLDLADEAEIRVASARTIRSVEIRPYSAGVTGRLEDNQVSFVVDRPQQLVLRMNDSYEAVLVICANRPQTPPRPQDVEHY